MIIGGAASLAIVAAGRFLDAGLMLALGTSAVTIEFGMLITFDVTSVDSWRASWWLVPAAGTHRLDHEEIVALLGAAKVTALLVTHDPTEAEVLAQRSIMLSDIQSAT